MNQFGQLEQEKQQQVKMQTIVLKKFVTKFVKYMDMGKASAMAWILFLVVLVLTAFVFKTSNKWVYYEGGED